jgi:diguanylate cyclase (GGDEF)-like protein/PAS domain S-box-containing protein
VTVNREKRKKHNSVGFYPRFIDGIPTIVYIPIVSIRNHFDGLKRVQGPMSHESLGADVRAPTPQSCPAAQTVLRQLADSAMSILWMTNADDVCIFLNKSTSELFGDSGEARVSDWFGFIHPDDLDTVKTKFSAAKNARQEYQGQYRIVRSDGTVRWMLGSGAPRFTQSGEFDGYNGAILDITAQCDGFQRLAKSEAEYRLLAENSSDLICSCTPDGTYIYASPSYAKLLGHDTTALVGQNAYDLIHPEDRKTVQEDVARQLETGTDCRVVEIRKLHANGNYVWTGTKVQVMIDPVTKLKTGTVSISRDITLERQERDKRRQSEERFRSLASLSSDWYWETDDHGRFTFISEGLERLYGIPVIDVIGRTRLERAADKNHHGLSTYLAKTEKREAFRDIPYSAHPVKDKGLQHAVLSGEPIFQNGVFSGYRGVGRDVTNEMQAADKFSELAAENRALIDNSLDIIASVDNRGCLLRVSAAITDILGYATAECVGRRYSDFLHPEERQRASAVEARLRTGESTIQDFETRWTRKDGSIACLSLSLRWSPEKELMYLTARDVTERFHIQAEVQRSKDQMSAMLESIGDAFFAVDRNWRITYVNHKTASFVGVERAAMLGEIIWEAVPALRSSAMSPYYEKVMATRKPLSFEGLSELSQTWIDVRVYPHEDGIAVYFHDVSARRQAERDIRESEQRLREVLEMTPAGYLLADAEASIIDVNPALCNVVGYLRDELVGHKLEKLFSSFPWHGALAVRNGPMVAHGVEALLRHKSGEHVPVLFSGRIKRDGEGHAQSFTAFLTDITERKYAESQLKHLATHDTLTGLPNRQLINERLQSMLDAAGPDAVAVMFIDLDRFKEVNDSMGHSPGDLLLRQVAARLQTNMRPGDIVARLGGDEFVVTAYCSDGRNSASAIAEKLLMALAAPFEIEGISVVISASIGISMFADDARTKELLFRNADTAMYRAKASGRNSYRFFETEMSTEAKLRMTLEHSLRHALEREEFELHYQPRIDLKTMKVVGIEALIRWNHPELGRIAPMQFIPIAEDCGFIESIGQWVLEEACMQTARLSKGLGRPLHISVNLSARQLKCETLVEQVVQALSRSCLAPELLELELTETALIDDMDKSVEVLRRLKKLGLMVSVDDFGTGYSGLSYLKRFPVDILKLDRSFVLQQPDGVSSFEFIKAFVDMAHALELSVVAEGIENEETLQLLRAAACDGGQGYYFARPLPFDELKEFLSDPRQVESRSFELKC